MMAARPPIPNPPYEGSCLCGAVRYRLNQRPQTVNACHCDACKKMSGGTNLLIITAPRDAFEHLSGEVQRFRRTAESGRPSDVVRCASCGTRLWHEPQAPIIVIAAGTLDDPSWVVPASHGWVEKASPAVIMQEDAAKFEGQAARDQQIAAFQKLYGEA
jgi:hypothetical protein